MESYLQAIWESVGPSALIVGAATLLWSRVSRLEEKASEQAADSLNLWSEINGIKEYLLNSASNRRH